MNQPPAEVDIVLGDFLPELAGWTIHAALTTHPTMPGGAAYYLTVRRPSLDGHGTTIAGTTACDGGLGPMLAAYRLLIPAIGQGAADRFLTAAADILAESDFADLPVLDR